MSSISRKAEVTIKTAPDDIFDRKGSSDFRNLLMGLPWWIRAWRDLIFVSRLSSSLVYQAQTRFRPV